MQEENDQTAEVEEDKEEVKKGRVSSVSMPQSYNGMTKSRNLTAQHYHREKVWKNEKIITSTEYSTVEIGEENAKID